MVLFIFIAFPKLIKVNKFRWLTIVVVVAVALFMLVISNIVLQGAERTGSDGPPPNRVRVYFLPGTLSG